MYLEAVTNWILSGVRCPTKEEQMIDKVSTILSPDSLSKLRNAYDREELENLFVQTLGERYRRTVEYVEQVHHLFHWKNPSDKRTTRSRLSEEDRERCTIALLAAKGEVQNLGVHVYMGLMVGISPEEIADVIFLAGIYSGVPAVTDGLQVEIDVLETLEKLVNPPKTEEPATNGAKKTPSKKKGQKEPSSRPGDVTRGPQPQPVKPNGVMAVFGALKDKFNNA
jgi:alkylhydroperoxidase/carboxymuconolactone decarboxylase family protein YurZ